MLVTWRCEIAVFTGAALLFAAVAAVLRLPGADGNAIGTYDVIGRLAHSFTYAISRTPGQPFLDYCNFVCWSLGGDWAVQAWFVLVSALGVTALYRLLHEIRGGAPLAGALTLALHPLFLGHVGGVGDFAVSLSFLVGALLAGARGMAVAAGLALGLAVGCRLALCIYVVPVAILTAMSWRARGASWRAAAIKGACASLLAGGLSLLMYAPLFAFYGWSLLKNFPMQSLRYLVPAFAYRSLVGYGVMFWAAAAGLAFWALRRRNRAILLKSHNGVAPAAAFLLLGGLATLFRMSGKPEYALPLLAGAILLFQRYGAKGWTYALLLSSVAAGVLALSPYDNQRDVYGWRFDRGWYVKLLEQARDNRLQINIIRTALASLPQRTLLVARTGWTEAQAQRSDVKAIPGYKGVEGLTAYAFAGLGEDRVVVHFQEPKLKELLARIDTDQSGQRLAVVYEQKIAGQLRRWDRLDLAQYGKAVILSSAPWPALWKHAGQSNAAAVETPAAR